MGQFGDFSGGRQFAGHRTQSGQKTGLPFPNNELTPNSRCEKIEIESRRLIVSTFNFNKRVKYPSLVMPLLTTPEGSLRTYPNGLVMVFFLRSRTFRAMNVR